MQVFKLPVVRHLLWRQMAMVIEDWLVFGVTVIKLARLFALQKEIFCNKSHGNKKFKSSRVDWFDDY